MEEVEAFVLVLEDSAEEVEVSTASGETVASMEAGIFREIHEWKLRGSASGSFHGASEEQDYFHWFPRTSIDCSLLPQPLHDVQVESGSLHCFHGSFHGRRFRGSTWALPWKLSPRLPWQRLF